MQWIVVLMLIALAGCSAGDGSGLDANGRPLGEAESLPLAPTLASLQVNLFDRSCAVAGCHAGGTAPLGLRLDRGFSYASLVGPASVERPDLRRVAPGAPDDSYLIDKIEGVATVGGRMPLNQPQLSAELRAAVRDWILAGAPPGAAATARVIASAPAAGGLVAALPVSLSVSFSRAIDASTLSAATVLLDRSGVDRTFTDGNEVPIAITALLLEPTARQQLSIDLSGAPAVSDVYRLRLIGSGGAPIRDDAGAALDGDGDGIDGGDFSARFTVGDRFVGLQPTLASIQEAVFTPICTACHFGPVPAGELNLEAGNSAAGLIGVKRPFDPEIRVIPGDATNSFLVMKLEGNLPLLSQGQRMPLGGPFLPPSAIAVVRAWIDAGAAP
ncbi:MAG TPA: Ig-like domain-containing protein [Rhodocyclaceae bacterium]|nr:Ig-like domain-containing protein [Rhodocyclaceae bacterium]